MISSADQRLQRWGEWLINGRGAGSKGQAMTWGMATSGSFKGCVVPVKDLSASRTHDWFLSLPKPSQMLLVEMYCTGRTSIEHAAHLNMSLRTLYKRLHALHAECLEAHTTARNRPKN